MFSFFPCLPHEEGSGGFARPRIRINGVVTDVLSQGEKLTPREPLHEIKALWTQVVEQVAEQGLEVGVFVEMPKKGY